MRNYPSIKGIKQWAEEDRPREKLMLKGRQSLSDAELLAILMGSGNKNESALALAKRLLAKVDNQLHRLAKLQLQDYLKFNGIGEAKAISIMAGLELGRRRKNERREKVKGIRSSKEAHRAVQDLFIDLPHEEFWVLFLNRANYLVHRSMLSKGGITGTVVDIKLLFKEVLQQQATSIILCHNHPSGNLQPSDTDIRLTKKIQEAGKTLEIAVLDHLIITDNGYFSLSDEGLI